jgi:hypothetical protein
VDVRDSQVAGIVQARHGTLATRNQGARCASAVPEWWLRAGDALRGAGLAPAHLRGVWQGLSRRRLCCRGPTRCTPGSTVSRCVMNGLKTPRTRARPSETARSAVTETAHRATFMGFPEGPTQGCH